MAITWTSNRANIADCIRESRTLGDGKYLYSHVLELLLLDQRPVTVYLSMISEFPVDVGAN
jgi:hypothetical protein